MSEIQIQSYIKIRLTQREELSKNHCNLMRIVIIVEPLPLLGK